MARIAGSSRTYALRLIDNRTGRPTDHGVDLISVTSVISAVLSGSFGPASWWGYRIGIAGMAQTLGKSAEVLEAEIRAMGHDPNKMKSEGQDRGIQAHAVAELMAQGKVDEAKAKAKSKFDQSVLDWFEERKPDIAATEMPVICLKARYAGTLDALERLPGEAVAGSKLKSSLNFGILDFKSRKKPDARISDWLQLAAYAIAWEEMKTEPFVSAVAKAAGKPRPRITRSSVVLLTESGHKEIFDERFEEHKEAWLSMLDLYRNLRGEL